MYDGNLNCFLNQFISNLSPWKLAVLYVQVIEVKPEGFCLFILKQLTVCRSLQFIVGISGQFLTDLFGTEMSLT